ncbi:MAG: hypothetical protein EHM21_05070, partial [Chloroflexi bacterium]
MKIKEIRVVKVDFPQRELTTPARRESWGSQAEVANPMSRYPHVKRHRSLWMPKFDGAYVQVIAENGEWGLSQL